MLELIQAFPDHLTESLEISNQYSIQLPKTINRIVICGLGGSGIGGEIIKQWQLDHCQVPIVVCHNYRLPAFVNASSLVIACSYSGNTEETLSAVDDALDRKAAIIGITSGGQLAKKLQENEQQIILIPGGLPPRSALAYPLVQLAHIFDLLEGTIDPIKQSIENAVHLLKNKQEEIKNLANSILLASSRKKLIFYAEEQFKPVLLRACQQMNENAKTLAFHNTIPEMNHNEIVGWANGPEEIFVIFSRSDLEFPQNAKRLDLTEEVIRTKTNAVTQIRATGNDIIEQSLFLIHLFDWLSLLIAEDKGVDVMEVHVIDQLKAKLASGELV